MRWLVFLTFFIVACGDDRDRSSSPDGSGTAPTISNLTVSSSTVTVGATNNGQLDVVDQDGLGGLRLQLTFSGPTTIPSEVVVQGTSNTIKSATVPFVFALMAGTPTGSYTLSVHAIDGTDRQSNTLLTALLVQ